MEKHVIKYEVVENITLNSMNNTVMNNEYYQYCTIRILKKSIGFSDLNVLPIIELTRFKYLLINKTINIICLTSLLFKIRIPKV